LVTNQDPILTLVARCKKQDKTAQFELYHKYAKAMLNVAFRIVKDVHFAEDVMQESFLKAFTQLHNYHQEATFGSWLKRIVVNQSIDFYRKHQKIDFADYNNHIKIIKDDTCKDDLESEITNWKVQEVLNQINSLNDNYRVILNLSLIEGFDHQEIMEILQINSQQCRTTLSRAKQSLRNKMKYNG
jgi:RNA polymerase sigma-70 factor (ECF subfamily)